MVRTIFKKEILEQFISLRFLVLNIICITLIPLSFYVNYRDYENRLSDFHRSLQMNQEKLDSTRMIEIFTGDFTIKGYRSPSLLSVFASGLDRAMPRMVDANKTGLTLHSSSTRDELILTIAGKIDFIIIVQTIFSLIAILFAFDAICGEREMGTLKAVLSNVIPRNTYIMGKYLGIMVTLIVPVIVSLLMGFILLIRIGYPLFSSELLTRIILILISSGILVSIFSCIGLFVSSRVSSSKTSIVILLLIWIVMIIILPRLSTIAAEAFVPVDSDEVIYLEKSLLRKNLELEKGREIDEAGKNLPKFDIHHPDSEENTRITEERNRVLNPIRKAYQQKIQEGIHKIDQEYSLKKARQHLLALSLARISPVTSFNRITTNLAWTGEYTKNRFTSSAQAYQIVLNRILFDKIFQDISPSGGLQVTFLFTEIDCSGAYQIPPRSPLIKGGRTKFRSP